ncbi:MAG: hypothetical protein HKL80_05900, partial [Acidimicrobiales bacterium]|nr:hypothetical protein [Acidimicrobiales bacterium]
MINLTKDCLKLKKRATAVIFFTVAALVASSCSSTTNSNSPTASKAPAGLPSFYAIPKTIPDKPGQLIKSEQVPVTGINATAYRVMYTSLTLQNKVVPVTGLVYVPKAAPPNGGYNVVDWSHGTNGMSNSCAPSLDPSTAVESLSSLIDKGYEVTASDYQGEGTPPGILAYLVGVLSARNSIDIVSAVHNDAFFHASNRYIVWGHSEGGQTALFTWDIGRQYDTNLDLMGVVAGAPPSQFEFVYSALKSSPYAFYLYMAGEGFNIAYGNKAAPLNEVTTPLGLKLLPDLEKGCFNYLMKT